MLLRLRLLLLMLLPRPLSSNFGQARPWDVRCCCSSGCALQHDAAFLPQRCNNKFVIYWCSCDCCCCYCSRTLGVLGIGNAAAPSVALLVLPPHPHRIRAPDSVAASCSGPRKTGSIQAPRLQPMPLPHYCYPRLDDRGVSDASKCNSVHCCCCLF